MSTFLDTIVSHKRQEIKRQKELVPVAFLETSIYFDSPCLSLKKYVLRPDKFGIIAEFKRKSPSGGWINRYLSAGEVSLGYMQAGASALSILTDQQFFAGSTNDLREARKVNFCPILRKDFILDEYQVYESKSIGADAILLIASILNPQEIKNLTEKAHSLGMEVLLEIHSAEEFDRCYFPDIDLVGINARNLHHFTISLEHSLEVRAAIPTEIVTIAESGIRTVKDYQVMRENHFSGVLIGELFMREPSPPLALHQFIHQLQGDHIQKKNVHSTVFGI